MLPLSQTAGANPFSNEVTTLGERWRLTVARAALIPGDQAATALDTSVFLFLLATLVDVSAQAYQVTR